MRVIIALFIFFLVLVTAYPAYAQDQPMIAPEIGQLIAEDGIDAAWERFNEMANNDSLNMSIEMQGMNTLMSSYMQAGNQEAAQAVAEMNSRLTMSMLSDAMEGMGMDLEAMQQAEMAANEQEKINRAQAQKLEQKKQAQTQGKSRDDLERFVGLYGETGKDDLGRTIFVIVSCDGYLVAGPMWADVGPWWMRSAADNVFTYADSFMNFSMEFKPGGPNGGYLVEHEIEGIGTPMEWKTELPDGYRECIERPKR
jgi:hypothetical protein